MSKTTHQPTKQSNKQRCHVEESHWPKLNWFAQLSKCNSTRLLTKPQSEHLSVSACVKEGPAK